MNTLRDEAVGLDLSQTGDGILYWPLGVTEPCDNVEAANKAIAHLPVAILETWDRDIHLWGLHSDYNDEPTSVEEVSKIAWRYAEAYVALGYLPPASLARNLRYVDEPWDETKARVLNAARGSLEEAHHLVEAKLEFDLEGLDQVEETFMAAESREPPEYEQPRAGRA